MTDARMPGAVGAGALFAPLEIGPLTLAGRFVKTATSETRASDDGFVTDSLIEFYRPIARGGTPLIVTGNLYVGLDGKSTARQAGVDADDKIPGLTRLVDAVHAEGGKIFAQISHCGRQVIPAYAGIAEAVSASTVKDLTTGTRPRALGVDEIGRIVAAFGAAARRCRDAGFDGVQIHAGHGYLISQFLTPYTNRRRDAYGGPLEHRVRLLREVYAAVRGAVGTDYPVIMKINGADALPLRAGLRTAELVAVARLLEADGLDAVEVSVGHYESGFPMVRGTFARCLRGMLDGGIRHLALWRRVGFRLFWPVMAVVFDWIWKPREGFNLAYAREFKRALSIPVISVGGFLGRAAMDAAIESGACDAVAVGRGLIADPLLYRHLREGTEPVKCVDCNACVGPIGTLPVDCYHPDVRARRDAMLARELANERTGGS